jgi:hypothetical protein
MVNAYELVKEQTMISTMSLIYLISVVITGFYISVKHKDLVSEVNENNIKKNRRKLKPMEEYIDFYMFAFLPVINTYLAASIIAEAMIKLIRGKD